MLPPLLTEPGFIIEPAPQPEIGTNRIIGKALLFAIEHNR